MPTQNVNKELIVKKPKFVQNSWIRLSLLGCEAKYKTLCTNCPLYYLAALSLTIIPLCKHSFITIHWYMYKCTNIYNQPTANFVNKYSVWKYENVFDLGVFILFMVWINENCLLLKKNWPFLKKNFLRIWQTLKIHSFEKGKI